MTLYIFFSPDRKFIRAWTFDKDVADGYAKKMGKPEVFDMRVN